MERFGPALRRVAAELDLPRHARTDLLLELAADLEAVYEHHRGRGLPEDEAARRAQAAVLTSSEVIRRLGQLHRRPWHGWAEAMSVRLKGRLDLVLLWVGVLPVVATAVGASIWVLAVDPSPLAWSILALSALLAVVAARQAVRVLRDRAPAGAYLPTVLVLSAMAPALGLLAPILGLQRSVTGEGHAADPALLLATLAHEGATLLAGLLLGVAGLLVWFILLALEARRAAREVDALLAEAAPCAAVPVGTDRADSIIPLVRRRHG